MHTATDTHSGQKKHQLNHRLATLSQWAKALFLFILTGWTALRVTEKLQHTPFLDSNTMYIIGLLTLVLAGCVLATTGMQIISLLSKPGENRRTWPGWLAFVIALGALIYFHTSFRIVAITLTSLLFGFSETAAQGGYTLAKLYPYHPFIPIFAGINEFSISGSNLLAMERLALSPAHCKVLLIGCTSTGGILFFLPKGLRLINIAFFLCSLYLSLASFKILELLILPPVETFLYIPPLLLFWAVLNCYHSLRMVSFTGEIDSSAKTHLSPHVLAVIFWVFIAYPVFADIHNQFSLAKSNREISQQAERSAACSQIMHDKGVSLIYTAQERVVRS